MKFWSFINLPSGHWGPTQNLGPIGSAVLTFIGYKQTDKHRALRAHLLFQLLIVALSVSIFSVYSIKQKQKMFADFIIFFRAFSKFYKNKKTFKYKFWKFWSFINLPWCHVRSHTKFGPDRFSGFNFYWIQAKYIYGCNFNIRNASCQQLLH